MEEFDDSCENVDGTNVTVVWDFTLG